MAPDRNTLLERALDTQRRLEERGLSEEARVMLDLIAEVETVQPQRTRRFYTTSEAGRLFGVTSMMSHC
ncbi:MAG TPA: hypothetical protein VIC27_13625 [Ktedonobacterales bacterium]|jgi:hypothetical protein